MKQSTNLAHHLAMLPLALILTFTLFAGYANAQDFAMFSPPPAANPFKQFERKDPETGYLGSVSGMTLNGPPKIRLWGWSNNGKVAYSIEFGAGARGGQLMNFIVFDVVSDKVVSTLVMDSDAHASVLPEESGEALDKALYNLFKADISKAMAAHNITRQNTAFSTFPFKKSGTDYDCQIVNVGYKKSDDDFLNEIFEKGLVAKYSVQVTASGKKKIISDANPLSSGYTGYLYVCGYVLSPFENRALVIVAEECRGFEGNEVTLRFYGCHLGAGFK